MFFCLVAHGTMFSSEHVAMYLFSKVHFTGLQIPTFFSSKILKQKIKYKKHKCIQFFFNTGLLVLFFYFFSRASQKLSQHVLSQKCGEYDLLSHTCEVISLNTRSVSDSQFLCCDTLAEICPAILMDSPSFQPSTLTCRTLRVFSGPFNSILMIWLSPPGSSLVIQPMCLESSSALEQKKRLLKSIHQQSHMITAP